MKNKLRTLVKSLHQLFCTHEYRYIGRRVTIFSNKNFIYECHKCKRYEVTSTRLPNVMNDHLIDTE